MTRKLIRNFLIFFIAFILIASVFNSFSPTVTEENVTIPALVENITKGNVKSIEIEHDTLHVTLNDGKKLSVLKEQGEPLSVLLKNYGVPSEKLQPIAIEVKADSAWQVWLGALLPFLVPFFLISLFLWFMMRQVQGANSRAMSFGQSGARQMDKDPKNKVTFGDVAGADEAKDELMEVVEFLRNPKKVTHI